MYMSALKEQLLADDPRVIETILPNLAAYRAIMQGKEILVKRKVESRKEADR